MARFFSMGDQNSARRVLAPIGLALLSAGLLSAAPAIPGISKALDKLNYDVFYDLFYNLRPVEDQRQGPVIIVALDDHSLKQQAAERLIGWPWPRDQWNSIIQYAQQCGAKAVAFDVLFSEPSVFNGQFADDAALADAVSSAKIPVVFAIKPDSNDAGAVLFAPQDPILKSFHPLLGSSNFPQEYLVPDDHLRRYQPSAFGWPSLAAMTLISIGQAQDVFPQTFAEHFYGPPNSGAAPQTTFRYLSAINIIDACELSQKGQNARAAALVDPQLLKGKIVLVGAISAALWDTKQSPLAGMMPGVEYQATAMVNMLNHQRVEPAGLLAQSSLLLAAALLGALAAGAIPQARYKILFSALAMALPIGLSLQLFRNSHILWLPPAAPLAAAMIAVASALLWSFLVEDRQRKFFVKALTQYVSSAVVDELSEHPEQLRISSQRREMTALFTDIAGFTDLSEKLQAEELAKLLNFYLDEMSSLVLKQDGTVDKYVGDAIVSFWNAPLPQPDHAARACRAALAMHRREAEIAPQLAALGGQGLHTRLGINTGIMAVGNMGCSQKFNYSVLGDSVNLASRLEAANKMYGTSILLSHATAQAVAGQFLLRKIDALCVKGKIKPIAVYELISEAPGEPALIALAAQYEQALSAYQRQDWQTAEQTIIAIQRQFADDGPCKTLGKRIAVFRHQPPPPDWDGVFVAKEK